MPSYKEDLLFTQAGYNVGSTAAAPNVFTQLETLVGATSGTTQLQASAIASGVLTLPAATDTLVGRATTDTLSNKTLAAPGISSISNTGTLTLPTSTDTLVGRATTDTVSNKTLTGASSGNSVTLLNYQAQLSPIVGTGGVANVFVYTIPANTIGINKGIRVHAAWKHTTGSAAVTYGITLGATNQSLGSDSGTGDSSVTFYIFNNASLSAQQVHWEPVFDGTSIALTGSHATMAENLALSKGLALTFSVAATDQVTPVLFTVELMQ